MNKQVDTGGVRGRRPAGRTTLAGHLLLALSLGASCIPGASAAPAADVTLEAAELALEDATCTTLAAEAELAGGCLGETSWSHEAVRRCGELGLKATGWVFGPACEGGFASATIACCAPTGGESCSAALLGDAETCYDLKTWESLARESCAETGMPLTAYALGAVCDGGWSTVGVSCCPEDDTANEPEREACVTHEAVAAGGEGCLPEASWTAYAERKCGAGARRLAALATSSPCEGDRGFGRAEYSCCTTSSEVCCLGPTGPVRTSADTCAAEDVAADALCDEETAE